MNSYFKERLYGMIKQVLKYFIGHVVTFLQAEQHWWGILRGTLAVNGSLRWYCNESFYCFEYFYFYLYCITSVLQWFSKSVSNIALVQATMKLSKTAKINRQNHSSYLT